MAQLRDVMAYLCVHYPHKQDLSRARLRMMAYLADWRSMTCRGSTLTGTEWEFRFDGPYCPAADDILNHDKSFVSVKGLNAFGEPVEFVQMAGDVSFPSLGVQDAEVLDRVIKESASKEWEDFSRFVRSTYPTVTQLPRLPLDFTVIAQHLAHTEQP